MKNLNKAIIQVMTAVKGLEKNSKVGTGKAAYDGTKDKDVKEAFNQALSDAELCILPIEITPTVQVERWEEEKIWQGKSEGMKQKQSVFTEVKTKYLLLHSSGESIELAGYGQGVDTQDKSAGKATTYALKNCLLYTFLTPVGKIEDTDTTHSNEIKTPPAKKKAPAKKQPQTVEPVQLTDEQINNSISKGTQNVVLDGVVSGKYKVTETQLLKLQTETKKD